MTEMKVTPYEVKGDVDYDKLIKQFGVSLIDKKMLKRLEKYLPNNMFLRRGIFFAHRDLDFILNEYEKGNKFYLYTGRGPSEGIHIGHLISYIFTKQLQDAFGVKLIFQMTDDEKFLFKPKLSLEETNKIAYENALDIIACGFDPKKTEIIVDTDKAGEMYKEALKVAKKLNFSNVKALFGFDNTTNIGSIFFTAMQAVPAFIESVRQKKNIPCLIPHGIDQDTHFRATRDILPKLGFLKPASIQCKFAPGLQKGGKMSASEPDTAIFTTDSPKDIERKIKKSFSGGKDTKKEHRKYGGNPDIDMAYQYLRIFFESDDKKLKKIHDDYKSGKLLSGELKQICIEKVQKFIKEHQKKREKAKKELSKFIKV